MFAGREWWLAALIVGYAAVVPLVQTSFGQAEEDETAGEDGRWSRRWGRERRSVSSEGMDGSDGDGSLETLRERYARGELTDEQFERKLERLLETETIEDVEDRRNAGRELQHDR